MTATQTETGAARTAVTDETGSWVMPNLPLGPYRLEMSLQGFRTYVQTGIVLQVDANPVINAALGLGNLEETVSVEAAAPLVDVRSAGISQVVEQERIVQLPLQGRNVTDLIMLAGAAVNTGRVLANLNRADGVAIAVAGGLRTGVAYTLDGALNNDFYDNTNLPFPFPDALQEFSVDTSGRRAQNGMHSRRGERGDEVGHELNSTAMCSSSSATASSTRQPTSPLSDQTGRRAATASIGTSSAGRWADRSFEISSSSSERISARALVS